MTSYGARGDIVDANGKVLADSVMRYDIAALAEERDEGRSSREEPDPDDPDKTMRRRGAARAGRRRARRGRRPHRRPGAGHHRRRRSPRTPTPTSPTWRSSSTPTTYEQVKALDIPWVVPTQHPSRALPERRRRRQPRRLRRRRRRGRWPASSSVEDACLAGEDGEVSYLHEPARTGCRSRAREVVAQAGARRRHAAAHDRLRPAVVCVQRIAEAQAQAVGADWAHGRSCMEVEDRQAPRRRRRARPSTPTTSARPTGATAARAPFTAPFEPGSTFKAITAASVIDAGKADPLSQVIAALPVPAAERGRHQRQLRSTATTPLHPHRRAHRLVEHRHVAVRRAADRPGSATTYMHEVRARRRAPRSTSRARSPGDLHGGPDDWDNQTKYATMFGQGLTTTAVQIASVYQTLANGGVRMPVQLVDGCTDGRRRP